MKKVDEKHSQNLWEDKVEEAFVRSFLAKVQKIEWIFCNFGRGNQNDSKNYEVEGCDKNVVYQNCWSYKISMWVETKKECRIM